jgi:hypothetical protein
MCSVRRLPRLTGAGGVLHKWMPMMSAGRSQDRIE